MSASRIYLDSCIFIAYSHEKDKRNKLVKEVIERMEHLDVEVFFFRVGFSRVS